MFFQSILQRQQGLLELFTEPLFKFIEYALQRSTITIHTLGGSAYNWFSTEKEDYAEPTRHVIKRKWKSFREPQLKRETFLEFQTADIVDCGFS